MICSIDRRASEAGAGVLRSGGSAVDAAIAASAVLTITSPYACGMGGDLFALVHTAAGPPTCLNASGRSGSLADAGRLREEGLTDIPRLGHPAAVTIPGCVDGWMALHERHGRLPLADVLAPALSLASEGFAAGRDLAARAPEVAEVDGNDDIPADLAPGTTLRRPGSARALQAILSRGREGFYGGEFGEALVDACPQITADDLLTVQADWVTPLQIRAWDHDLWTTPPNSQGYITLAAAALLQGLDLPDDPDADLWAHLTVEASRQAGWDRPTVLHEAADGDSLLSEDRLAPRRAAIDPDQAAALPHSRADGGTIYLCAADDNGSGVSLIQSNAQGFGAGIVAGGTSIFLHNRGLGFSLEPGHPAEYGPNRRPPHTLSPALVTRPDGSLRALLGTMGGDAQPQVVLQLLARLLVADQSPRQCIAAARWRLGPRRGNDFFGTWDEAGSVRVVVEAEAPESWATGLAERGHEVVTDELSSHGHAHMIDVNAAGELRGAADPRAPESGVA